MAYLAPTTTHVVATAQHTCYNHCPTCPPPPGARPRLSTLSAAKWRQADKRAAARRQGQPGAHVQRLQPGGAALLAMSMRTTQHNCTITDNANHHMAQQLAAQLSTQHPQIAPAQVLDSCGAKPMEWRRLLYWLSFFHAVVQVGSRAHWQRDASWIRQLACTRPVQQRAYRCPARSGRTC